jgi:hypothetical protein
MLSAWVSLFQRGIQCFRKGRPASPQLTSLENPENYQSLIPTKQVLLLSSAFDAKKSGNIDSSSSATPSTSNSRADTPILPTFSDAQPLHQTPLHSPRGMSPQPSSRRLSQVQPEISTDVIPHSYTPMRDAPSPPFSPSRSTVLAKYTPSRFSMVPTAVGRNSTQSRSSFQKTGSTKVRGRISSPIPASFMHVTGAFHNPDEEGGPQRGGSRGRGPLSMHPVDEHNMV